MAEDEGMSEARLDTLEDWIKNGFVCRGEETSLMEEMCREIRRAWAAEDGWKARCERTEKLNAALRERIEELEDQLDAMQTKIKYETSGVSDMLSYEQYRKRRKP